jgi:thiamine pyrophosphate-dependent acetolactate synthase large subunit-like protein
MWMFKISDLVEVGKKAGVSRVCDFPGDPPNGPTDALRREGTLSPGTVRRDEVAAFVAAGEAPLAGELAVCPARCALERAPELRAFLCQPLSVAVLAIATPIPTREIATTCFQETRPLATSLP